MPNPSDLHASPHVAWEAIGVVTIAGPLTSEDGLDRLAPLWQSLHRHHLQVASYAPLVDDLDHSWARRRAWYERMLGDGGSYLVAGEDGRDVGYAFLHVESGLDDTFEVKGGVIHLVSLVVDPALRSQGVGAVLMRAVERIATVAGIDTLKVAVMAGNDRARSFYLRSGFAAGEEILYRRLPG